MIMNDADECKEPEEALSPIQQTVNDFINSKPYIRHKIKNGKANCDRCGAPFAAIHPTFVCLNDSDEEILCYPCNYKRLGINVEEVYKSKRSEEERILLEIKSRNNNNKGYERQKSDKKKAVKKNVKPEPIPVNDLFSELKSE